MSDRDPAPAGFQEFVAARRTALLRSAYLLTGDHDVAEDLVEVALVKAVPHWRKIADHPEPYVRRILARESISRWRQRRWREVTTDQLPEQIAPTTDHDDELRAALGRLAPRQRAVIVLRYYEA